MGEVELSLEQKSRATQDAKAEVAQQLCDGSTLVTANKRLAREVLQQFNQHQLAQGKQAWDTADILPFEAWVFRLWQFIRDDSMDGGGSAESGTEIERRAGFNPSGATHTDHQADRIVLNALQSKAVWTKIISEDINTNQQNFQPLWNIAATVKTAMDAWRISRQWDIAIDDCGKSFLADHRSFARWANLFIHQCQKNNWMDAYQLIDVIIERVNVGKLIDFAPLIWMGFDSFNAQQKRLIAILRQNNIRLSIHQVADSGSRLHCQFRQYESESEQWLAAAHWIKDKIDHRPNQRLAVVAPNLNKSRGAIDYALSQILSPCHVIDSGSNRAKPFHISLGVKLNDSPVVDAALLLLSLTSTAGLTNSTISKVILTPFIGGADSECHARNKFEFWCRRYLPYELKFSGFLKILKQRKSTPPVPIFFEKIISSTALTSSIKKKHSFSYWSEFFLTWLENFGWPGERVLNSEQYQTVEAFKRELSTLGSLDLVANPVAVSTALSALTQRLNEKPFEPESPRVKVDVLGIMETAGIEFDAIWFGGLTERDWPPAVQESPFIPHSLQRQANYHRASVLLNADHARAQQNRLLNQCDEIVFSRYCFDQDVELLPSAFFDAPVETSLATAKPPQPTLIEYFQKHRPQLETFTGTQGLGKSDPSTRGGTSVIQDQAACPFRAYARHRLGACDADAREPGLSALDRGTLIHRILEGAWRALQSSEKLASMPDHALKQIIDDNIATCSKRFFHKSGSGKGFFQAQAQWLSQLLLQWFAVEKNREQEFRVVELEKQQQLTLGKLTLNFKIDRMDELADDTLMLIDYKTGMAGSIKGWFGERPKEPQLPLYALAQHFDTNDHKNNNQEHPLSTLAFGQIRAGQNAYVGISDDQPFQTAKHASNKVSKLSDARVDEELKNWPALIEYWNEQLVKLADQYYDGHAEVNPLDNTTCTYCDLQGLCRIFEAGKNDEHDVTSSDGPEE